MRRTEPTPGNTKSVEVGARASCETSLVLADHAKTVEEPHPNDAVASSCALRKLERLAYEKFGLVITAGKPLAFALGSKPESANHEQRPDHGLYVLTAQAGWLWFPAILPRTSQTQEARRTASMSKSPFEFGDRRIGGHHSLRQIDPLGDTVRIYLSRVGEFGCGYRRFCKGRSRPRSRRTRA